MTPQRGTIVFGFDSAWTDNQKGPGAICAIAFDEQCRYEFHEPGSASFNDAWCYIDEHRQGFPLSLVAIDQPTIVPNHEGSRPVEKVAASVISYVGGGVQPSNRGKAAMFGETAPIWSFLSNVAAEQNPIGARTASAGHFLIEVFPALALPAWNEEFYVRRGGPKYNPISSKFRLEDWKSVARVVQNKAQEFGVNGLIEWSACMRGLSNPGKSD